MLAGDNGAVVGDVAGVTFQVADGDFSRWRAEPVAVLLGFQYRTSAGLGSADTVGAGRLLGWMVIEEASQI